jgi:arylsulfatase A-like enzyme
VRYVDSEIGRLFQKMRELGMWEDTVVVITSDHGEGLNQHDWASHGLVWDEQLRVPLLIRFPGLRRAYPRKFPHLMSSIDIFPTVMGRLEEFGTPLADFYMEQVSGVDVLAHDFEPRPVFSERTMREMADDPGAMVAVTGIDWKFVHYLDEETDHLYDRHADPYELVNLAETRPKLAEVARAKLMESMNDQSRRGGTADEPAGEVDPELLKQLQELGYVGGPEDEDEEEDPDPR